MLNKSLIFGAILLGMAVPSTAQSARGHRSAPANREVRTSQHNHAQLGRRVSSHPAPVLSSRRSHGRGHDHARTHQRGGSHHGGVHLSIGGPRYRTEKVWVPAREKQVFHPAEYTVRWDPCLRRNVRVLVCAAHYDTVIEPGHWEYRQVRVRSGLHFHF